MISQPRAEWLEADGLGGFASGTVSGIRTRRYHALLLAATTPPSGRMVLVNGFDAAWILRDQTVALSTQRYRPGINSPDGATNAESFTLEPWPRWTWSLPGGGRVTQEIFVPHDRSAVAVRWRAENTAGKLLVRPFFSGRDFHALHHENTQFNFTPEMIPAGQRWTFYPGVPAVTARGNGVYHHEPCWYYNFLYDEEAARGMDSVEDLAAPGIFLFEQDPAVLIFSTGDSADENLSAVELAERWAQDETKRRKSFPSPRHRAADAYLVARGTGKTIIAGYPWFGDWGRDTFISMRGLCLATARLEEARDILTAWSGLVSEGMLPNRFPDTGGVPEYNSVDASLWYIIAVHEFLAAAGNNAAPVREGLLAAVDAILIGYSKGTRFGIRADIDGLLSAGVPGMQLTWMDAKVNGRVVTPRIGKPVEVQALWLNALAMSGARWKSAFEKGRASFEQRFWNESRGCLYDVIDCGHQPSRLDDRLRPNQLFAVGGLPIAFFEGDRAHRVVDLAEQKLWTPMGPRSLAPGEKDYAPYYRGDLLERDNAYHQGTVWPWLAGPFLEAWVRVRGGTPEAKKGARVLLEASELLRTDLQGLGHVPEIADAEPPHTARGCPFQAWSLGEILRLQLKILQ